MSADKIHVKLFATTELGASLESYIPVFHRWIREKALPEMLIDVADYTHVPRGIGVLLVGHGSDVAIDEGEGRPGVLFVRKRSLPPGSESVEDGLGRAIDAAGKLDADPEVKGPRKFGLGEVLFRFPDRLSYANDDASFAVVRPRIEAALARLLPGQTFTLTREGEPREALTVRAKA